MMNKPLALALCLFQLPALGATALADELRGELVLPTVFAFRCDVLTGDPSIRDCPPAPGEPDPYGAGGGKLIHWTHSWIQVTNLTGLDFSAANGDEMRLYLYGQNGEPIDVDDSSCAFPVQTAPDNRKYLDLLNGPSSGFVPNRGVSFIYVPQCLNDGHPSVAPDSNPPFWGVLAFRKLTPGSAVGKGEIYVHAGWEEGVLHELWGARYHDSKAGSLVDKERVVLQKVTR